MWAQLASSLPSCSYAQHLVGQRTLYREAIRENCELSCAKLWYFTLVSTEFIIILDPWLHTMLAPTTCSSARAIMTALATNATNRYKACASARGSWLRRRKSLTTRPPKMCICCWVQYGNPRRYLPLSDFRRHLIDISPAPINESLVYNATIWTVSWFQACLFGILRERSKREKPFH